MGSVGSTKGSKCVKPPILSPTDYRSKLLKNLNIKGVTEKEGEGLKSIPMVTSLCSGDDGEPDGVFIPLPSFFIDNYPRSEGR